eukprot:TRINITY_DN32063_c0_g1_i1.p1 TRINITY_DN32063_c0_g1~~TRINITY_DN32063_c0_g1_i1.p1  ORF type:complete len:472 (+),score=62.97 TRINITY_DN32063_c0_g1_i1:45-1460(+)
MSERDQGDDDVSSSMNPSSISSDADAAKEPARAAAIDDAEKDASADVEVLSPAGASAAHRWANGAAEEGPAKVHPADHTADTPVMPDYAELSGDTTSPVQPVSVSVEAPYIVLQASRPARGAELQPPATTPPVSTGHTRDYAPYKRSRSHRSPSPRNVYMSLCYPQETALRVTYKDADTHALEQRRRRLERSWVSPAKGSKPELHESTRHRSRQYMHDVYRRSSTHTTGARRSYSHSPTPVRRTVYLSPKRAPFVPSGGWRSAPRSRDPSPAPSVSKGSRRGRSASPSAAPRDFVATRMNKAIEGMDRAAAEVMQNGHWGELADLAEYAQQLSRRLHSALRQHQQAPASVISPKALHTAGTPRGVRASSPSGLSSAARTPSASAAPTQPSVDGNSPPPRQQAVPSPSYAAKPRQRKAAKPARPGAPVGDVPVPFPTKSRRKPHRERPQHVVESPAKVAQARCQSPSSWFTP